MRYLPNLTDRLWAGEQLITDSKNRGERVRHVTERETYGTTARVASLYTREWRHARPIMHQSPKIEAGHWEKERHPTKRGWSGGHFSVRLGKYLIKRKFSKKFYFLFQYLSQSHR